jgi:hypothetical protein
MPTSLRDTIQRRLSRERGTIFKSAPLRVALTYPSPYSVAMSSLGFQTMYRELNGRDDTVAERAFYPDDVEEHRRARETLVTYEGQRPLGDYPVVALSRALERAILEAPPVCFDGRAAHVLEPHAARALRRRGRDGRR